MIIQYNGGKKFHSTWDIFDKQNYDIKYII